MCGYYGFAPPAPQVGELLAELGIRASYPSGQRYARHRIPGLLTAASDGYALSDAWWWFLLKREGDSWLPNLDVTSFNARNLDGPLWRSAIRHHRGVVFATELGEAKGRRQYLLRGAEPFALGMVYRDYPLPDASSVRATALITRPPHPRYSRYHDKSIPLLLPLDPQLLRHWLDPHIEDSAIIGELLANPRLTVDFAVEPVKSYKRGESQGPAEKLPKD